MRYPACQRCTRSVGAVNVGGNLALSVIKGFLGVVGGSQALVADAIHSLADLISSSLLVVGMHFAERPADDRHPYGYGKVEFLVAVAIYGLLLLAGAFILWDSVHMILEKEELSPSSITLFGALLSAVANEMMYRQSKCAGGQLCSPSMLANAAEKRADVWSSLAVLVGIAGAKLGFHFLDPAAAVLVACLILHSSVSGMWSAFQGLIDRSLDDETLDRAYAAALNVPGVADVGAIRSREMGQRVWMEIEITTDGRQSLVSAGELRRQVKSVLAKSLERPGEILVYVRAEDES